MNNRIHSSKLLIAVAVATLSMAACSTALVKPDGADSARNKLSQLQADPQLATRAPVAIKEAEIAVSAAEVPREDADLARHLVIMADRKVDIAVARAQSRLAEDERKMLSEQRESARLDSRTREADVARSDADAAQGAAEAARLDTAEAQRQTADLQAQIAALNAQATDRGLVVTLGDVLFATGKSDLKGGSTSNLSKLSAFLNEYSDRTVVIEGHTDSVGDEAYNLGLSQRRADAVRSYLVSQGIAHGRVTTSGLGEGSPTASNDSATGRQQNRRVEVIISNTLTSSR